MSWLRDSLVPQREVIVNPIEVSAIIIGCIFGDALLGIWLHNVIPEHHLNADSQGRRESSKLG